MKLTANNQPSEVSLGALREEVKLSFVMIQKLTAFFADFSTYFEIDYTEIMESKDSELELGYYSILSDFESFYRYAFDGAPLQQVINDEELEGYDSELAETSYREFQRLIGFVQVAKVAATNVDFGEAKLCELALCTAVARGKLDTYYGAHYGYLLENRHHFAYSDQDELSLREVALLANMNEKSVRNATHQSKKDRLKTTKIGSGSFVKADDALTWLKQRRGFKPTKFKDIEL